MKFSQVGQIELILRKLFEYTDNIRNSMAYECVVVEEFPPLEVWVELTHGYNQSQISERTYLTL